MNENIQKYVDKLVKSGDLMKLIQNKQEAVKFISQETKLPEAQCESIDDAVVEKVKGGAAEKLGGLLGDKFKLPF